MSSTRKKKSEKNKKKQNPSSPIVAAADSGRRSASTGASGSCCHGASSQNQNLMRVHHPSLALSAVAAPGRDRDGATPDHLLIVDGGTAPGCLLVVVGPQVLGGDRDGAATGCHLIIGSSGA
jgi:hypothetical protein